MDRRIVIIYLRRLGTPSSDDGVNASTTTGDSDLLVVLSSSSGAMKFAIEDFSFATEMSWKETPSQYIKNVLQPKILQLKEEAKKA